MHRFRVVFYYLLYQIVRYLPDNYSRFNLFSQFLRGFVTRRFITRAGKNININKNAELSPDFCIGNNSGVGSNSVIGKYTIIGDNVMMGQECIIYTRNHDFRVLIYLLLNKECKISSLLKLVMMFGLALGLQYSQGFQ